MAGIISEPNLEMSAEEQLTAKDDEGVDGLFGHNTFATSLGLSILAVLGDATLHNTVLLVDDGAVDDLVGRSIYGRHTSRPNGGGHLDVRLEMGSVTKGWC